MVSRPTDPLASVGGPEKCRMKECKAYKNRCNKCNLFGHYESCCNKWTKERGRKSANDKSYQQRTNKVKKVDYVDGTVLLRKVSTSPEQVKTIARCNQRKQFTTTMLPNHIPLRLEIETLYSVALDASVGNDIVVAKEPVLAHRTQWTAPKHLTQGP